jgi:exonuclease III
MNTHPNQQPSIRLASINSNGIKKNFTPIIDLLKHLNLDFIACQETWLKPGEYVNRQQHLMVMETRLPNPNNNNLHQGGLCIIRHPTKTTEGDFKLIAACSKGTSIWFKFRNTIIIGAFYLAARLTLQERQSALNSIQQHHHHNLPMAIFGDFNIRLGHITGDSKTSPRAHLQSLATNLDQADLNIVLPAITPTWTFVSHVGRSVIDYAAISTSLSPSTSDLKVISDGYIDSPHNPIWLEIAITTQPQAPPHKPPKWNLKRLKDNQHRENYEAAIEAKTNTTKSALETSLRKIFRSHIHPISDRKASHIINHAWNTIENTINKAASATIGKPTPTKHQR